MVQRGGAYNLHRRSIWGAGGGGHRPPPPIEDEDEDENEDKEDRSTGNTIPSRLHPSWGVLSGSPKTGEPPTAAELAARKTNLVVDK